MLSMAMPSIQRIATGLRCGGARLPLVLLLLLPMLCAHAIPLRASWRAAAASDQAERIRDAPGDAAGASIDPAVLNVIHPGTDGAWIVLRPTSESVPATERSGPEDGDRVLAVEDPGMQSFSYFPAEGPPALGARLLGARAGWQGHGRIGFVLDGSSLRASLLIRMEPGRTIASPIRFALMTPQEFRRADERWLALATACFAIMAAMAIMALLFAVELRDITFVHYAGYVLAYTLIFAIQTGYVAAPLEWGWIVHAPTAWGRAATALSVLFATLFVARFAELSHYAPRMRIAVLTLGISTCGLMFLGSIPIAVLSTTAAVLINPLLILGGPLILAASAMAWWRGSRYAGFFLIGWTPLLVVTVLGSAQVFGVLSTWTWLGNANLVAGAFEALVLSLGLADRALALRRDRDIAQALADTDGLTGVFNRRGLDRCVVEMIERAQRQRSPLTLLFLDLDRFKSLNDRQGHAAGDAALIAVTRLMRSDMRVQDVLGRYGGEEFLAVLPGCNRGAAVTIAERIRTDLQALLIPVVHAPVEQASDALTASIGVACLRRGDDADSLIARADAAMYVAKRSGGNHVSTDIDTEAVERAA